jgi:sec-independent protein translocase protein TatA
MIGMPGPMELMVLLGVALLIMGPKKLPDLGKSLGQGMRSFKESVSGETPAPERQIETPKDL